MLWALKHIMDYFECKREIVHKSNKPSSINECVLEQLYAKLLFHIISAKCMYIVITFLLVLLFLFLLTFYWFFVKFTLCTPIPFISPSPTICPLPLQLPPHNRWGKHLVEIVVYHSVSHSIPFCPHFLACKHSLEPLIGLVQGLWLLLL